MMAAPEDHSMPPGTKEQYIGAESHFLLCHGLTNRSPSETYAVYPVPWMVFHSLWQCAAGHAVKFPREPYREQISFMQRLISAIDKRSNALLEAPTGCGKTLAILCGVLAWAQTQTNASCTKSPPCIYYATRTHSQIAQV